MIVGIMRPLRVELQGNTTCLDLPILAGRPHLVADCGGAPSDRKPVSGEIQSSTCSPAISPHLQSAQAEHEHHRPPVAGFVGEPEQLFDGEVRVSLRFLRGVSMPSHGLDGMSLSDAASAQMPRRIPRLRSTTVALLLSAWVLTYSWISARVSDSSVRAPHCGSTWTRHARLIDST